MADSVKVAVRVRPFNDREKKLGASCIVRMERQATYVTDPVTKKERKPFAFDYSYWSFNSADAHYVDNQQVFKDLGILVLENAWGGYNCCLFAYGQTGSGKSYSMVGYGEDRGIVPLALEEMFERIAQNKDENVSYMVEASMLEIYNEKVRDLFAPGKAPPGGLRVRDHPKTGPYVENLNAELVRSYDEVEALMEEGTAARTVASTNMNATSSRAHTIFQIIFTKTTKDEVTQKSSKTVSKINLVDLAGSERSSKTGATGARLKEGININKSLTVLGMVIQSLAKRASSKKKVLVPYRDSVLTFLLKQSLGGNSKTIMIAAISPASDNYEETTSTLRYADRAKQIKNVAVINEDENARVIRQLKKEIEMLRSKLKGGGVSPSAGPAGMSEEERLKIEEDRRELNALRSKMQQNESILMQANRSYEEKLKGAMLRANLREVARQKLGTQRATVPHFVNLHKDFLMSETIFHFFADNSTVRVCRKNVKPEPTEHDMVLNGLGIQTLHAIIQNTGTEQGDILIEPQPNARVFVNGKAMTAPAVLEHNDRIIIGAHHCYRLVFPTRAPADEEKEWEEGRSPFNWEMAQKELHDEVAKSLWSECEAEQAMQSLSGGYIDEESKRQMEELERKMAEERKKAEEEQSKKEKEYKRILEMMNLERQKEIEEMKRKMEEEADAEAKEEWEKKLKEREDKNRAQQQEAEEVFKKQQEEMKRKAEELEAQLQRQKQKTAKLERQKEVENRDRVLLEEKLMEMIPMVNDANGMCMELEQPLRFSIKLRAHKSTDVQAFTTKTDVMAEVKDNETGVTVVWDSDTFAQRIYQMQEIYNNFLEYDIVDIPEKEDANPFIIRTSGPVLIGAARIYLQPLYHLFPIDETTPIIDYKGAKCGSLIMSIVPIPPLDSEDEKKREEGVLDEEDMMFEEETVEQLKGKMLELRLNIVKAIGLPQSHSHKVFCQYVFAFLDDAPVKTLVTEKASINPIFEYERNIMIDPVTEDLVETFKEGLMEVSVYGELLPVMDEERRAQLRAQRMDALRSRTPSPTPSDISPQELLSVSELLEKSGHVRRGSRLDEQVAELVEKVDKLKIQVERPPDRPGSPLPKVEIPQSPVQMFKKVDPGKLSKPALEEQFEQLRRGSENHIETLEERLQELQAMAHQRTASADYELQRLKKEMEKKDAEMMKMQKKLKDKPKSKACVLL